MYLPSVLFSSAEAAIVPVVPGVVQGMGAPLAIAGLVASMLTLGIVLGDIPSGWLVARFGERMAMLWSALLALVGVGVAAFAHSPFQLAIGILVLGVATATFALARHALLTTFVPLSHRARALSLLGGMFRAGAVIGPLLSAGLIALTGQPQSAFWLSVGGISFAALAVVILPDPSKFYGKPPVVQEPDGRFVTTGEDEAERETAGLFRSIYRHRAVLLRVGTASLITGALRSSRAVLLPLWAVSIGLHDAQTALIIGLATGIDFAFFYASGYIIDRWGRLWSAIPTLVVMAVAIIVLSFTHGAVNPTTWFIACAMLFALGSSLGAGIMLTLGSDLAPRHNPAPFLGAFRFMVDLGNGVAPLYISGVTALISISVAAGSMGVIGLVGAGLMLRYVPRYIRKP